MADDKILQIKHRVKPLDQGYIKSILEYDPLTGDFYWKKRNDVPVEWNTRWADKKAGSIALGYIIITINYVDYRAHVLAWVYMGNEWPKHDIDHKDMNRSNNAYDNLRVATRSQNKFNTRIRPDNTSGYKGIDFHKNKYWRVRIMTDGLTTTLGYFLNIQDAVKARNAELAKYHGEFARFE